jgi:hypothetical protein
MPHLDHRLFPQPLVCLLVKHHIEQPEFSHGNSHKNGR